MTKGAKRRRRGRRRREVLCINQSLNLINFFPSVRSRNILLPVNILFPLKSHTKDPSICGFIDLIGPADFNN